MNTLFGHLYNCWQFENSLNGVAGQPFYMPSPVYEAGKFAGGLRLTVGGSTARALGTGSFKAGGVDWTGMFWFKPITLPASSAIVIGNLNNRWGGWEIRLTSAGVLSFSIREGAALKWTVTDPIPLAVDTQNLICFGYDNFNGKSFLRVNDTQLSLPNVIAANPGTPANIVIGNVATAETSGLDAVISLLSFWQSRVLEESDLQALWNSGYGVNYPFS